ANVLVAVPCLGIHFSAISWVWPAVSAILMLRQAQRVSGGRACFAVLTPPLFLAVAGVVWIAVFVIPPIKTSVANAQSAAAAATATTAAQSARTQAMLQSHSTAESYA